MEIPKNPYACAKCHKRFNNPTILIKHVELRHSIAKKSQNGEPKENYASIENQDSLENTSLVPFEFTPITPGIEIIFPQEIKAPMKDQIEEIRDQDNNSEAVSLQEIDSVLLKSTENENPISKTTIGKVPINNKIEEIRSQDKILRHFLQQK